ncbi:MULTISPECIES: sigma-70 family RNA polymerase sigma factor [unclassified Mesorhizobium]|uniref:RNA polymerase sigma factor n=1 Tax=unclassified Mesorhizobium TaxID=325217 RepID=UPI001125E11B|nr:MULTISPECIES: sigma-70 family RNA polymerase sigma factor [unclassified Mesorhizobium]TPJ86932.1 sigma-70 family RNA polymerase sigma factor [Mesorhizobium sp. B2-5-12]TPK19155.1 sigma-70 family RNA polymerase sigma factor [Mesorhizobium sp. B2-5-6]
MTRPKEFDAKVIQWLPFLRKMAFKMERSAQDREDLVNETVVTALHRWASYREGGSFPGWLVFQMRERCHAMRSKKSSAAALSLDAKEEMAGSNDNHAPWFRDLSAASLPATQSDAVELAQVFDAIPRRYHTVMAKLAAGYEQKEIAASEGVSRQAIHQRITACRARLKKVAA